MTTPTEALARAWSDLPPQLQAHPGIKALHRAALAQQPSAPSAEPACYTTGIKWPSGAHAQSEQVIKVTRQPQPEYGFSIPLYSGAAPLMANGLTPRDDYEDGDSFAGMGDAPQAATASVAGLAEPTEAQVSMLDPWMRPAAARELLRKVLATGAAQAVAPHPVPLPARLVHFTLRDLKADRKRLEGFNALGNELARAAEYDEWIAALETYCAAHGIPAAAQPTKE